jgi:glycosyltransferase involved in cell wall biosynthesis
MTRPRRIDQVLHILADKDAIGTHVLLMRDVLRSAGYESEIYAGDAHPEVRHLVRPLSSLPPTDPGTWILFHHSTGSDVADAVLARREPILLDYHNVTPAALVARWAPQVREELELGVAQLQELATRAFFGIAHSRFTERELVAAGCLATTVAPPLVDLGSAGSGRDEKVLAERAGRRNEGGSDWLFVGRVSPHKAQHDLVKALACYRRFFDPQARLTLVGTSLGEDYPRALWRYVVRLGLDDAVTMTGAVSAAALRSYYDTSDVFVCASDHEGFCVPLVEAMALGLPVVAYDSSAVGETVGDGGLVLCDKSPMEIATAVSRVLSDPGLRFRLIEQGRHRAAKFTLEPARTGWVRAIEEALDVAQRDGIA